MSGPRRSGGRIGVSATAALAALGTALLGTAAGLRAQEGLPPPEARFGSPPADPKQTWVELGGRTYGARPDARGPIGGGAGYRDALTTGDHVVRTADALIDALARAKPGEVVFVPGDVTLDLTERVVVEDLVLEVPGGVTLASDRGHEGSPGALLFSEAFATRPLLRTGGAEVRLSGLRLLGPDPRRRLDHHRRAFAEGRGRDYYYRFPTSDGVLATHDRLRVDNCELAGWSHAAVFLRGGRGHQVHHSWIHRNQRQGLGYGVCLDEATARIERNLFDFNRHSIAGTGRPGSGYQAVHNVELGESLSHCFDMHGGRDRGDGTDVAGDAIEVRDNTFRARRRPVVIRGVPREGARITGNWFPHHAPGAAVRSDGKTEVTGNAYGADPPRVAD